MAYKLSNQWFFWDETGGSVGPFKSEADAKRAEELYALLVCNAATEKEEREFLALGGGD